MTAEVAILNRTAVALAADSAVTLAIRGQTKVYNGADKLFQLVHSEPVGIMVYGNAEFMGVPFETVVKEFRASALSRPNDFLKDYSDAFFGFMLSGIKISETYKAENIANIVYDNFQEVYRHASDELLTATHVRTIKQRDNLLTAQFYRAAKRMIADLQGRPDNSFVNTVEGDPTYADIIKSAIADVFQTNLPDETVDILRALAYLSLKKDVFSKSCSGLVFAGFGRKEIFPTLQAFSSDGYVGGDIKRRQECLFDIDREAIHAHIEAFAQKEMVHRFLEGIDPDYEEFTYSAMEKALDSFGTEIVNQFVGGKAAEKKRILKQVTAAAATYFEAFKNDANIRKTENYRQKVLDMVHFMSKSDLASMAESLVNLTSIKRKVSAETETVGGPVDVAVISKHEGFVWIKRKHYFDAELNPRYFLTQKLEQMERDARGHAIRQDDA